MLGAVLVFCIRMTWWKIAAGGAVTLLAVLFYRQEPVVPFTIGVFCLAAVAARDTEESGHWLEATWGFAKQIMPLLFWGVLVAGLLLGRQQRWSSR